MNLLSDFSQNRISNLVLNYYIIYQIINKRTEYKANSGIKNATPKRSILKFHFTDLKRGKLKWMLQLKYIRLALVNSKLKFKF